MGYNPQESLENTINTIGTLLGVHLNCIYVFPQYFLTPKPQNDQQNMMRTMSTTSCLISQEILHAVYTFAKQRDRSTLIIINL